MSFQKKSKSTSTTHFPAPTREEYFEFISNFTVLDVTEEVVDVFGRVRAYLRQKNELVENFDVLIAATCITHDLTVVTYNDKHFSRIPGLKTLVVR